MAKLKRIGLAVDAVGAYGRGIVRGVTAFCRTHPDWIIVEEPQWSFSRRAVLKDWQVDGIIAQIFSVEFENEILARGVPATNVSNFCDAKRLPTVLPDDEAVGVMAAKYLSALGVANIGYVWMGDSEFGRLRLRGFRKAFTDAGIPVHECKVMDQELDTWLKNLPKPAAVLGCNDEWAHRVLKATRRVGIQVPDEVAVLGVDDDELINTLMTPSLSSIAIPAEQIGYEAAAQLDRLMEGQKVPVGITRLAPLRVVNRKSTEVLLVDDPDVAAALRFISEHAGQPIHIEDLLQQVPLSRRSLERRFREALKRSVSEEIRRVHVERAKQLLITTDFSIKQIAKASGFDSATRLGISFQKESGEPPSEFRRRARMGSRIKPVGGTESSASDETPRNTSQIRE